MDLSQYSDEELQAMIPDEGLSKYSDDDLKAMLEQPDTMGERIGGAMTGAADMMTGGWGDEMRAAVQAPIYAARGVENPYDYALEQYRAKQAARQEDTPLSYGVGQVAGGIGTAAALAPKALSKGLGYAASKGFIPGAAAAGGVGAVSGGVYGAGSGEEGSRVQSALEAAPYGAAGGVVGASVGSLASRALKLFGKKAATQIAKTAEDVVPENIAQKTQKGEVLDLSQGAVTQNPKIQSLEKAALSGGLGDSAEDVALRAQAAQQGQIRGIVGGMSEGGDNALQDAAKAVKGSYNAIKGKVNAAYDDARIINKVYISQSPIDEIFKPQVNALLKDGGFDVSDFTPRAQKLVKDIQNSGFYEGKKVTAQNLEKLEFWRRKATNAANDAYRNNPSEGKALNEIVKAYDNFMAKLPEHALMSGDEGAIEAINKARYLRKTQGVLFERNKVVKNLVQNKDLTNEEIANMVLTGSKAAEKINKGAGGVVKAMRKAIPEERQGDFTNNLKRGTMARILKKSEGSTLINGEQIIQPNKLIKELDNILENKTFMNELFDESEQNLLSALKNDLVKINSVQKGADNYSNTAYTLMRFFNNIPFAQGAGKVVQWEGDRKAGAAAKQAFSPVLKDLINDLSGQARTYGAITGGAMASSTE